MPFFNIFKNGLVPEKLDFIPKPDEKHINLYIRLRLPKFLYTVNACLK